MEDIRGVTINSMILRQLEERGWVEVIGQRESAGRPALYATTRQFLDDLGLESLEHLPSLDGTARGSEEGLDLLARQAAVEAAPHQDGAAQAVDAPTLYFGGEQAASMGPSA